MTTCDLPWRTFDDDGVSDMVPAENHSCVVPREKEGTMIKHEHHRCGCGATLWTPGLQGADLERRRADINAEPSR